MQLTAAQFRTAGSCLAYNVADRTFSGAHSAKDQASCPCSSSAEGTLRRGRCGERGRALRAFGAGTFRPWDAHNVCEWTTDRLASPILCVASTRDNAALSETTELSAIEQEMWRRSCEGVINLGFSAEEAHGMVSKAFGWKRSAYWGEQKDRTLPDPDSVAAVLSYLRELGLSDPELGKLVQKFPEVLGLLVEEDMKKNVALLENSWGISGNMLKNLLLRTPGALGFKIDCKGDCQALCTRCWARM